MNWFTEWPVTEGYFWCYGWRDPKERGEPDLFVVQSKRIGTGPIFFADGQFLYKGRTGRLWFMVLNEPDVPKFD